MGWKVTSHRYHIYVWWLHIFTVHSLNNYVVSKDLLCWFHSFRFSLRKNKNTPKQTSFSLKLKIILQTELNLFKQPSHILYPVSKSVFHRKCVTLGRMLSDALPQWFFFNPPVVLRSNLTCFDYNYGFISPDYLKNHMALYEWFEVKPVNFYSELILKRYIYIKSSKVVAHYIQQMWKCFYFICILDSFLRFAACHHWVNCRINFENEYLFDDTKTKKKNKLKHIIFESIINTVSVYLFTLSCI